MKNRKDLAERRHRNRFKVIEGALVEFYRPRLFNLGKPRMIKSASIIDISVDGLAFQYIDRDMWSSDFNELSISNSDTSGDADIDQVPFKAVSDFSITRISESVFKRRCGVKFGDLTSSQKSKLLSFIKSHKQNNRLPEKPIDTNNGQVDASEYPGLEKINEVEKRQRMQ